MLFTSRSEENSLVTKSTLARIGSADVSSLRSTLVPLKDPLQSGDLLLGASSATPGFSNASLLTSKLDAEISSNSVQLSQVAPNSLQFDLTNTTVNASDTLSITNGWVYDANGATDLSRVDFWIRRSNGTWLNVSDATTFIPWFFGSGWAGFNYNLNLNELGLGSGNYTLWAQAYDFSGNQSNVVEQHFTIQSNFAPTSLQFVLDSASVSSTGSLNISNGWVYDANGTTDISRVDFWVGRSDGSWINVSDATTFTPWPSDSRWAGFNYSLNLSGLGLGTGSYTLWAQAYDRAGTASNVVEQTFAIQTNVSPTSLQFGIVDPTVTASGVLNIANAWVYDANGTTDISRVDFWVRRSNGTWLNVSDATTFTPWEYDSRWAGFNYSLDLNGLGLGSGNYTLWAQAYDLTGAGSNVIERSFTIEANSAPNSLQFSIDNPSVTASGLLNISNGWVYDANGTSDISRVDFWVRRSNGTWLNVSDAMTFTPSTTDSRWARFNYHLNLSGLGLTTGAYTLWAQAYDRTGTGSNVIERSFVIEQNFAPNQLQFSLDSTSLASSGSLNISNAWVYDANGTADLSRVDFWIRRSNGSWINISDATTFTPSSTDSRWARFNYSLNLNGLGFGSGNYTLWATAYDRTGVMSNVVERSFSITTAPVNYSLNSGYGLVNAAAAVAQVLSQTPFPSIPDLGSFNWNLDQINAPEVWARGYTGQGVVVAVIDSGVDYNHADLDANIWRNIREVAGNGIDDDGNGYIDDVLGWDFVDNDNNPMDFNGHGTHVAGTIAAERNNFGTTGVAYNARIMPVRVLGSNGSGSSAGAAAGIRYAADNGADVINLSLGSGFSNDIFTAVQYATQRGAFVVMAAGNSGQLQPGFPANLASQWGIAVGATDIYTRMAPFSNRAGLPAVEYVVAPGADVRSTTPFGNYDRYSGTSMAAPHVAGVAALMLSANPNLTPTQIRNILTATANPNVS